MILIVCHSQFLKLVLTSAKKINKKINFFSDTFADRSNPKSSEFSKSKWRETNNQFFTERSFPADEEYANENENENENENTNENESEFNERNDSGATEAIYDEVTLSHSVNEPLVEIDLNGQKNG